VGGEAGSLGSACVTSDAAYDGVGGAYLGLGIDACGSVSNPGDMVVTGPGFRLNRITRRGARDTHRQSLSAPTTTADRVSLRKVSQYTVCWRGTAGCSNGGQMGWRMDLPGGNEQIIDDPQVMSGLFVVNTTIPASNAPLSCNARPPTGYTLAIAVGSGGAPPASVFSSNNSAEFDPLGGPIIAGAALGGHRHDDAGEGPRPTQFCRSEVRRLTGRAEGQSVGACGQPAHLEKDSMTAHAPRSARGVASPWWS
jgi:Tfp pilus tip-associated adhesin PilY1